MYKVIVCGLLVFVIASCGVQKNKSSSEISEKQGEVNSESAEKLVCENNTTDAYKLCLFYEVRDNVKYTSFKIIENASNELIYEQTNVRKVSWISDFEIRVDNLTRMPSDKGVDDYYLYDVMKKKKLSNNKL